MARPVSWLKDLHAIRKRIADSVRSHYTREELEDVFGIQQSAAAALMRRLPTTRVGTSLLVKREDLSTVLDRVHEADDVAGVMKEMAAERAAGVSRRKLRGLVRRDYDAMSVYGIPEALTMKRGEMKITWKTPEDLAATLLTVARILEDDLDEFVRLYQPIEEKPQEDEVSADVKKMFAELETDEEYFWRK
jgi:hypothetical protein